MGGKQLGFGAYEQTTAKKRIRREHLLSEMEAVVPWNTLIDLIDLIEPHYPKTCSTEAGQHRAHRSSAAWGEE